MQNRPIPLNKNVSSSGNAGILTGGTCLPRYNTSMAFFRYPFRKLVKFCENFVFRGWQRLVIFCEFGVVRVVELFGKFLEKFGVVNE